MTMLPLLFVALAATVTDAASQTIYQCRSQAGKTTLQDSPCPDNSTTELERKSIGQRNAEYRAEPTSFLDPNSQPRLVSSILCPSLRQSYQHAVNNSQTAMLSNNPEQIQRASEAIQRAGAQMSKYRCE